jgi:3-oxo-5-alpha-steroid 4-dehydrogenase 3 / polyprenol reductase
MADWQVPKDWFWTFYALSLSLITFWPGEGLWLHGPLYGVIRDHTTPQNTTMSFEALKITWVMMLVQAGRRLYESLTLVEWEEFGTNKKQSMMFGGHWVLGLVFYTATSVSFWIEGIRMCFDSPGMGDG